MTHIIVLKSYSNGFSYTTSFLVTLYSCLVTLISCLVTLYNCLVTLDTCLVTSFTLGTINYLYPDD